MKNLLASSDVVCPRPCGAQDDHQPFPQEGDLAKNLDLSLAQIGTRLLKEHNGVTYGYVIATVKKTQTGNFRQEGCGPNFLGNLITLCTCKHRMRTFLNPQGWAGKWIAGFTGASVNPREDELVYLTKVEHAFPSHYQLWSSGKIPTETLRAKAARMERFGDLFEPLNLQKEMTEQESRDWRNYHPPAENHCHHPQQAPGQWKSDIFYPKGCSGRPAALLVGDPQLSFLWRRPSIKLKGMLHRGQRKWAFAHRVSLQSGGMFALIRSPKHRLPRA